MEIEIVLIIVLYHILWMFKKKKFWACTFQARQNATRVITNLSRQRIDSRLIAAEYLENNIDLMNMLILG